MGGMAILFWQKEKRLLEERYLNVTARKSYLDAVRKAGGFEDWDRALIWKCLNCIGARLSAVGFFDGNKKVEEWLTRGKGPQEIALQVGYFQRLQGRGFTWVIFKDDAVSCLHQAKCIYNRGVCISCGKESKPYISVGIGRKGWAPILKNHRSYCIGCYQQRTESDNTIFMSNLKFQKERQKLRLVSGGKGLFVK